MDGKAVRHAVVNTPVGFDALGPEIASADPQAIAIISQV
jgi:hypothetical protein